MLGDHSSGHRYPLRGGSTERREHALLDAPRRYQPRWRRTDSRIEERDFAQ
jgi:hypothetical protein